VSEYAPERCGLFGPGQFVQPLLSYSGDFPFICFFKSGGGWVRIHLAGCDGGKPDAVRCFSSAGLISEVKIFKEKDHD
jgi:hypothetical protein